MKKKIYCLICCAMIIAMLSVMLVPVAAAEIDRTHVYEAGYGTPIIDGVRDAAYDASEDMAAENVQNVSDTTGTIASAKYWMLFDAKHLYIYCEVTDTTRSDEQPSSASATKMDNVDMYIALDPEFDTEKNYADGKQGSEQGQFRVAPNILRSEENLRAASWGGLTFNNQMASEDDYDYKASYTDTGYKFEIMIRFSEAYEAAIAKAAEEGKTIYLGFSVQINDVTNNDAGRDAMVYSNNAQKGLSTDRKNCGKVALDCFGVVIEEPAEETTTATETTTAQETTTEKETTASEPQTTPAETTKAPEETTVKAPEANDTTAEPSSSKGCGSVIGNIPFIIAGLCAGFAMIKNKSE